MTIEENPASPDAVRLFHEGIEAERKGDLSQAYQLFLGSVTGDPSIAGAWNNLGVLLHRMKRYASAAAAFYKACHLAPDAAQPPLNYAWNIHLAGRSEEARPILEKMSQGGGGNAVVWTNLSQVYMSLDMPALSSLGAALNGVDKDPLSPVPKLAVALAKMHMEDYAGGLIDYEARFPTVLPQISKFPYPRWDGGPIDRLFIVGEQGLGDSIHFMRFIPLAAKIATQVIVHIHAPALAFCRENMPENVTLFPIPTEMPAADAFCPLMSLPSALKLSNKDIKHSFQLYKTDRRCPYVFPKDGAKRIGICWAGEPVHDNDEYRSMDLKDMLPISELIKTQIYSLQVGSRRADIDAVGANGIIKDLSPYIRDVSDTAAIIESLDVVVTVDTAVAHIAGAVGKRTYLLLPKRGLDWRWANGGGMSCWYPSVQMIRQDFTGEWADVIRRVRKILSNP